MSDVELEALLAESPRDSDRARERLQPETLAAVREALEWLDAALEQSSQGGDVAYSALEPVRDILLDLIMGQYDKRRPVPAVERLLADEAAVDRAMEAELASEGAPEPPKPAPAAPAWRLKLDSLAGRPARVPVEQAREVDPLAVLQRLGMRYKLERSGRKAKAPCPFHDDRHPSMEVDVSKGLWYCFPCGKGGDMVELVRRAKHLDFADAVRFLVEEV